MVPAGMDFPFVFGLFLRWHVPPRKLDLLLANGWRRFGPQFYRYSLTPDGQFVLPLRLPLDDFRFSKSQRRVLRKNADLEVRIEKVRRMDTTRLLLFDQHKARFKANVPPSLEAYLGPRPDAGPCETFEVAVYQNVRLVAASYFDEGQCSVSSIYGMFDLAESGRRLGTFTMLVEIAHARERSLRFYYPGYSYIEPSVYDYKKRLGALEYFDWKGSWKPLASRGTRG